MTPNARPTSSSVHGASPEEPEAQLDHLPVALGQRAERELDVLAAERQRRGVERRLGLVIGHEVPE